ncbi:MAG: peptidoglycan-binding protein, and OmpA, partial [Candidatus Krumholzibacteriota bacterium]|nr:peptidoglycan-binding protein, and OmpA [Candidatus Krumholzibacteriota bacterium]
AEADDTSRAPDRTAADDTSRAARVAKIAFGILDPAAGSIVSKRDRIEVTARVPLGSAYALRSGGAEVAAEQIGRKEIHLDERYEDVTWYGVKIETGWNTIALAASPADGSAAVSDSVEVALTGKPVTIDVTPGRVAIPADGKSGATIRVALRDDLGFPAINGLAATVVEGDTLVLNEDADPDQPGLQVPSEDGVFLVRVRPSSATGRGRIEVESHGARASCLVAYVPSDRPLFLSGIVEGRVGAFDASGDGDPLGLDNFDDGVSFAGESRFFVQGTAFGGINLTARVDTKKRYDDPLLKTDNPETQYPIYGDESELHYAAPAQAGNYVALEKGQSFLRYGDFKSPLTEGEFLAYKRSSTGLDAAFASGANGISAFVTKTDFYTVRDEIPGDGTSGYYYLSRAPVVENSVDLTLEVRDRYRPEKLLEIRPLVEHRDFTVSYYNGAILFKEPVPAFTGELNPVTIAAIYEARALYGADGSFTLGPLELSGEAAQSDDDVTGKGNAYKLQIAAKNLKGEHSLYFRRVDGDFLNPSFTGSAHELYSRKVGFDSRLALSPRLSLDTHAFQHRFDNTGEEKSDVDVFGRFAGPRFMLGGGVRAARQVKDSVERDGYLSMVGAGVRAGRAELQTHWEMNLGEETVDDYPDRLRSAFSLFFLDRYKATATHEYLSAHGRPATHQLLAGLEARAGRNSTVYTKYSMTRTAGDERLGTILGLKRFFPVSRYVKGSLDIEGFRSFSSRAEDEYVALKTGLGRVIEGESAVEGRYEYRWQHEADRHLVEVRAVKELENGVAVLFKDALSIGVNEGQRTSLRMEGRLGGVYRPVVTPLRALLLLKTEYDRYSPVDPQAIRWTTVLSTDVNVFPQPEHELRLKLAAKRVEDFSFGISETNRNYLVLTQYVYHFAKKWDLDAWARFLGNADGGTRQTGVGIELGRVLFDRVRIGAGYSVNGFEDRDMAENEAWERGFGIRVQLILSDWMFNGYEF